MNATTDTNDEIPEGPRDPAQEKLCFIHGLSRLGIDYPDFKLHVERWIGELLGMAAGSIGSCRPTDAEIRLSRSNKIEAIKQYRSRTGTTLKDAKDAIEKFM